MDQQIFERIAKRIDDNRDDMIVMQKHLISFKAISPVSGGKGEYSKAKYLEPFLKAVYDDIKEYHAPFKGADKNIRPNYLAVLHGKDKSRTMWIMAHIDVVPEGDIKLWNTDPFTGTVVDGKIYGRGAEDNNQAIVSGIYVAKAFKEEKIKPPINIGLLLVSDEENGSDFGVKYIINNHKDVVRKSDLIVVPDSGDPKGETIEVAEKAVVWVKATCKGKQTHGSTPEHGINAHRMSAHLIIRFDEFYKRYNKKNELFSPATSTFEPTKKEANVPNVNTIPGEDIVYFDCRLLPDIDADKFVQEVKVLANEVAKEFKGEITIELAQFNKAAPPTSPESELAKAAVAAMRAVNKVEPKVIGIGGNTVAQQFRELGLPAIVCSKLEESLHAPNEYCVIDNMVSDSKVWAHIALQH